MGQASYVTTSNRQQHALESGLCCELGQRDEMSNGKTNRERMSERNTHTLVCECKRWLSSRCSCDGQIRDSGVEAAAKSRSIIHRDRSSHCRKLWKQNILNGLSHPIHKRQLSVTHTHPLTIMITLMQYHCRQERAELKIRHEAAGSTYDLFFRALQVLNKLHTQCYTWLVKTDR